MVASTSFRLGTMYLGKRSKQSFVGASARSLGSSLRVPRHPLRLRLRLR